MILAGLFSPLVLTPGPVVCDRAEALCGLNGFVASNPVAVARPAYRANLRAMAPFWFRVHHAGMVGDATTEAGWWDAKGTRWDEAKIAASLGRLPIKGSGIVLNVPNWMEGLATDGDGLLTDAAIPTYAARCADLVRLVNGRLGLGVRRWEVTNELDGRAYADLREDGGWGKPKNPVHPDAIDRVATIFVACARAMKKADPKILVGGPAAARPDLLPFAKGFVRAVGKELDFYSFHAYASGDAKDPDDKVYARATAFGEAARSLVRTVREAAGRDVPTFFDEYNVSWTWETRDPRMTDARSAVFDALAIEGCLDAGLAGMMAWNERDGVYGKTDADDRIRPSGRMFALLNAEGRGAARRLLGSAVVRGWATKRAAVLINRGEEPAEVRLDVPGRPVARTTFARAPAPRVPMVGGRLRLPPTSVTLVELR